MNSIEIFFEDVKPVRINIKHLKQYIEHLLKNERKDLGDISLIFSSDEYLLKLNKQFLDHDYYTDIITFDYVESTLISGDLFISIDRVKENAVKFGASFLKELYRVIFHGVLHLVGYGDKTKEEKSLMRNKEDYYLNRVDFSRIEQ